jgi:hypothetical protein
MPLNKSDYILLQVLCSLLPTDTLQQHVGQDCFPQN